MKLASGLKLSIDLHVTAEDQWIEVKLEDELNMTDVTILYPVRCYTTDRSYHLKESMVIGVRRVVAEAVDRGLISDSPGKLAIWKPQHVSPGPMLSTLLDE